MVDFMRAKSTGASNDYIAGTFFPLGQMKIVLYMILEETHGFLR
jgi:hypothetical protein